MKRSFVAVLLVGASLLVLTALAAGCGSGKSNADDSKSLENTLWKATEITGVQSVSTAAGASSTAKFADGKISGSGGVNSYSGTYTTGPGNAIQIGQPASTMMAGPDNLMAQETAYFAALQKAATYQVDSKNLTLLDKDGKTLVKFEAVAQVSLTSTQWTATAYNNGKGALQSLAADTVITAEFATNGTMQGNATINTYNTTYTAGADGKMTISDKIAVTQMAGPEESMAQESAYLAAIPKTATYAIEGDTLTLRDASGAAMAQYVVKGTAAK
jgi:heat shock protein HslJ